MKTLGFLLLPLLLSQFLYADTYTVCDMGCDYTTITDAIAAASSGDIIDVQNAVHTEENINIDKNLTIKGQGQTTTIVQANAVQANAVDGVFKILTVGLTVIFQDMTIQNGNADGTMSSTLDNGGGVYIKCNAATNVTFTNVTITNNKAQGDRGGGVYITDDSSGEGTVTFTNCVISNNEATGSAGDGGGVANRGADVLTMTNCTISGNIAGDDGGGYYVFEDGSTNKFINCTIFNNSAGASSSDEGRAGGLYFSSASTFSLFNCTIVNNTVSTAATLQGAGIYHTSSSSTLELTNTIVANNSGASTGNDIYTASGSTTFTQTTSLCEDCGEGGGTCPQFTFWGDPNLASVATCGVHSYFPAAATSFINDTGTAPGGDIPTDDICGTNRSAAKYDLGSYDDAALSTGLVETTGDLEAYFCTLIDNLPLEDQNDYAEPSAGNLTTWDGILDDLLADNTSSAHTSAATIDYEVILFTDNTVSPNILFYLLQKTSAGSNYWGTYVFNSAPCREIVIEAAHPIHDYNTGKQAVYCLKNSNARALLMTGTHRCNNTTASGCSGTTEVCTGMDDPFKISDMAHNSNNCFQATSDKLHDAIATSVLIHLHGFGHEMGDPYVILSNGTTFNPSGTDYANDFKTHLAATDGTLTFKVAHIDNYTYLIGTTNTQGRYINGENTPCTSAATAATGRFIHLEQERTKLREDATGWEKVSTAMENLVACGAVPIEWKSFEASLQGEKVLLTWETASETNNDGFYIERGWSEQTSPSNHQLEWENLGFVAGSGNSFEPQSYSFVDKTPLNGVNYYRLQQLDYDGAVQYSEIETIYFQKGGKENDGFNFQIIPNPVINQAFVISFDREDFILGQLKIYDSFGRIVQKQSIINSEAEISTEGIAKGIYLVELNINGLSTFKRIVIQ